MMVTMRRHTRPENARPVRRKLYGAAKAEAEIGSRVFPLPAPPAPMPSVGTRRSTRVFVPKTAAAKAADSDSRVLRSGKRLAVRKHGDEWSGAFGGGGAPDLRWWKGEEEERRDLACLAGLNEPEALETGAGGTAGELPESNVSKDSLDSFEGKKFGFVYRRKRRRQLSDDDAASSSSSMGCGTSEMERKYGMVFERKGRRKRLQVSALSQEIKLEPAIVEVGHEETSKKRGTVKKELRIAASAWNFAMKNGITENSLCTSIGDPMVLSLLVEYPCSFSSRFFSRFLITTLSWMRKATLTLWEFAAFLLSGQSANVFSQQGIHVLPLTLQKNNVVSSRALNSYGLCKICGAKQSVPLLSLNFAALPFYFRGLHVSMLLGSLYLPRVLARYLVCSLIGPSVAVNSGANDSGALVEAGDLGIELSVVPVTVRYEQNDNVDAHKSATQNAIILHDLGKNKLRRKRSSSRNVRSRNPLLMSSRVDALLSLQSNQSGGGGLLDAKASVLPELTVKPIRTELPDAYAEDLLKDESDVSTPCSSLVKQRKSAKSPVEQNKELKSALAEVKKNIDSVSCQANVLVTYADRCWREEGFEVSLDMLASKEWCIAVKSQGQVRHLHRPLNMRPCVVNRFTHAYMWAGEDMWKLEFLDRWDWLVFKELHTECQERNLQEASSRVIPVPVFKEVSGYDNGAGATFIRSDEYIKTEDDQVQRSLVSNIARYDMDSGDEQWLVTHNSSIPHKQHGEFSNITADNFENIIYVLEKDAYSNIDHVFDKEKALDIYQHLGKREMLGAIYDYWIKKRTKRRAALVREFQGPPLLRAQLVHKPFVRKRRSFKRQRSQTARTTAEVLSQVGDHEEALQRVQEARNAANRAVDFAIHQRSRAQMLMENAELALYKSFMALRMVECLESPETSDLALSILD